MTRNTAKSKKRYKIKMQKNQAVQIDENDDQIATV